MSRWQWICVSVALCISVFLSSQINVEAGPRGKIKILRNLGNGVYIGILPDGRVARIRLKNKGRRANTASSRSHGEPRMKRSARKRVQRRLNKLGFNAGKADGKFGRGTRASIRAWQASRGFAQTGYLTTQQLRALFEAPARQPAAPSHASASVDNSGFSILPNTDLPGYDYRNPSTEPALLNTGRQGCINACQADRNCNAFTYNEKAGWCWLKSGVGARSTFAGAVSGIKKTPLIQEAKTKSAQHAHGEAQSSKGRMRQIKWRRAQIGAGTDDRWQTTVECYSFFRNFRDQAHFAKGISGGCGAGRTMELALRGCNKNGGRECRPVIIKDFSRRPPEHTACAAMRHDLFRMAQRIRFRLSAHEKLAPGKSILLEWQAPRMKDKVYAYVFLDKETESAGANMEVFSGPNSFIDTFYPPEMREPGHMIWIGGDKKATSGLVRFRPSGKGRFRISIQLAMAKQNAGKRLCAAEFFTLPEVIEYDVRPQGRFAESRSCHLTGETNGAGAPAVQVSTPAQKVRIGEKVPLSWRLQSPLRGGCKTPLYLMLSMPDRVRFQGKGFIALAPGTPGPFGLKTEIDRTRVFVPLNDAQVKNSGRVVARLFQAEKFPVKWSIVEVPAWTDTPQTASDFDETKPIVSTAQGNLLTLQTNPGQPSIVVQNREQTSDPLRVVKAADANYDLQIYKEFYRVLDRRTGELIIQRDGREPGFSPTSRFVSAISDKGTHLEIVDLYSEEVILRWRGGSYVSQAILGLAWGRNDSYVLYAPFFGGAGLRNILVDGDEFEIASTGFKKHSTELSRVYVDLENATLVYEQEPQSERPIWTSLLNSSQTTLKNGSARPRKDVGDLRTVFPKIDRLSFRWHLGDDTRFQLFSIAEHSDTKDMAGLLLGKNTTQADPKTADTKPGSQLRLAAADFAKSRTAIRGQSSSPETVISRVKELTSLKITENASKLYEAGHFLKQRYNLEVKTPVRPDEELGKALLEHINSAEFQDALVTWRDRKRQTYNFKNAPVDFACEYDVPDQYVGRFALPGRIMARTAFQIGGTRFWLLQQDCVGGSGWRRVQLGLFVKRPGALPEYLALDRDKKDDDLGVGSGELAKGWLTTNQELLVALPNRSLLIYDVAQKRRLALVKNVEATEVADGLHLTKDRKILVKVDSDGRVSAFRFGENEPVLSGFSFDDELVLYTSDGYYSATPEGAHFVYMKFAGVNGLYTFHQFAKALHRPGIVRSAFASQKQPPRPRVTLPPSLSAQIKANSSDSTRVTGSLRAAAVGRIDRVQVYQDGILTNTIDDLAPDKPTVFNIERLRGTRWIALIAVDDKGIASQPVGVDLGPDPRGVSRLVSLNIGIDQYAESRLDLKGAARDAEQIQSALSTLPGEASSKILSKLTNSQATREGILRALTQAVESAGSGDTLIISYAGHGLQDSDGTFYLTSHHTTFDNLNETGITWQEIGNILKRSRARIVLLLDACQSGAAGTNFFATNDQAASELLAGVPSNIMVFAAAKGREFSYEAGGDAGGSFSKAVAEVISAERTAHDLDGNGAIEVSELFAGVKRKVVIGGREVREQYAKQEGLSEVPTQTPWLARNQMIGDFKVF